MEEEPAVSPVKVTMKATMNGGNAATFSKTPAEQILDKIYDLQNDIEAAGYGSNKEEVQKAIDDQKAKSDIIEKLSEKVEDVCQENQATSEEIEKVKVAFDKLKNVSEKKTNCLDTMQQISSMQQLVVSLSRKFDCNAVDMINLGEKELDKRGENIQGFISFSAQDCIFSAKDNWEWIVKTVKCMDTHLQNASRYQQFFHEVEESSVWLYHDLKRIHDSFSVTPMKGDYQDGQRLLQEIQDVMICLKQWETKTHFMWEKAVKVVPVHHRTKGISQATPVRAIVDYETSEIKIRDEEDLLLLDNSDEQLWKVRNARGNEGYVPSVTVLIPGPTKEAIEAAVQLRLRLLAAWTNAMKIIGRRLIVFMLLVFKPDYDETEIATMRSIKMMDRQELMRILDYVENTLHSHWGEHDGFHNLQERILVLKMILEDAEDNPLQSEEVYKALIVQISTLEELMKKYEDLRTDWEKNKTALESAQAPELMLIVDKWEQLKFVSREQFAKMWQHELPFTEDEKSLLRMQALKHNTAIEGFQAGTMFDHLDSEDGIDGFDVFGSEDFESLEESIVSSTGYNTATAVTGMNGTGGIYGAALTQELDSVDEDMFNEDIDESAFGFEEHRARGTSSEASDFGYATETKTAQTEQLSKAEVEESKRFVIKSVIDPKTDQDISLEDAILSGIIKADEGIYVNSKTGISIPIPEAMSKGLIKVSFSTTKRGKEKRSSIGIITVKTERVPIRPYIIKTVKDTLTNQSVSDEEGIKRGILNENLSAYRNLRTTEECLLCTAFEQGLAEIEYTGPQPEPEVIIRTYAVRAVVDRKKKKIVGFQEAVTRGIINKESGAYVDTSTGQKMYVGDAIMRGFLKARLLDNTKSKSMDIDPRNKLVIDATEKIRKKLVQPLAIINAMRKASRSRTESK